LHETNSLVLLLLLLLQAYHLLLALISLLLLPHLHKILFVNLQICYLIFAYGAGYIPICGLDGKRFVDLPFKSIAWRSSILASDLMHSPCFYVIRSALLFVPVEARTIAVSGL